MKVLTLGDVHGRDRWMFHTHGSPYEFNNWMTMIEKGVPTDDVEFWKEMPYLQYDKIVFIGDYVDSFDISNVTILDNLKKILFFKIFNIFIKTSFLFSLLIIKYIWIH